jgi:hypothetical protein
MIGTLVSLLVLFIVLAVIYYIVSLGAGHFGVPGTIVQIVGLILGLIFLLAALSAFGVAPAGFGRGFGRLGC